MYLNYSKIAFDKDGYPEQPMLQLRTLSGIKQGVIPFAYNVNFDIKYAELSTLEFDVPYFVDGVVNPIYKKLNGYAEVYTDHYGIYVLMSPKISGDGVSEIKHVTAYSIEQLFERKRIFLEEGTYNFWNPASPDDTVLGRVLELDPTWHVGYVDRKFIGMYRTFDEYENDGLTFIYNDAPEKYGCTIVVDPYEKTFNVYDAHTSRGTLPIYLSYENLVSEVSVDELSDDIVTKLHVYGSDDMSIREVNPTGADYIVNLDHFISRGDLDIKIDGVKLSDKVKSWQKEIKANQHYYTGLVALRASETAQKIAYETELTELNGELDTLKAQQNVIIQALALETTDAGKKSQQAQLDDVNKRITAKEAEVTSREAEIEETKTRIENYASEIATISKTLSMEQCFTEKEMTALRPYLIDETLTEETFVATDIDSKASGAFRSITGTVVISESEVTRVDMTRPYAKQLYTLTGGKLTITSEKISATIIRGTIDATTGENAFVLSLYLGDVVYGDHNFSSGMLTMSGDFSQLINDVADVTKDEITEHKGHSVSITTENCQSFFTVNVSEYQQYVVAEELYDFGTDSLKDSAYPVYEFSLSSANFLFAKEFTPFRDALELGKGIHMNLGSEGHLVANIIGVSLNFEDKSSLSLTFSTKFQKHNGAQALQNILQTSYSASSSFDASKHLYNLAAGQAGEVSNYMNGTLNASVNRIIGASNQSVNISGAGIEVGSDKYQLRIVDNMIAMTDDKWQTAKLAIGRFATQETGEQWGVNAELLAGKLIIGNNMVLENPKVDAQGLPTGTMQFKVDSTGVWLNNSTMVLQKDNGGRMILDPDYGIMAGTKLLFTTNGTQVTPSFIDRDGNFVYDDDDRWMPKNANFFLDINTGNAYFRGNVDAESGRIGGFTIESDFLEAGTESNYVALNGSGNNENSLYAFWAGAKAPGSANFWVKKDGSFYAAKGTFAGKLESETGAIGGFAIEKDFIHAGSGAHYAALNGSSTNDYKDYAFWAGDENPAQANFYVKKDGSLYAQNGTFSGKLSGTLEGNLTADPDKSAWLVGCGINVGNKNFYVDSSGNVTMAGNIQLTGKGNINADNITLGSSHGGFCCAEGNAGNNQNTFGSMMYGSDPNYYFIATNKGVRMQASETGFTVTQNSIVADVAITESSDRRLKNSIEMNLDKYEPFFDALKPSTYKFNNGTSGRHHIGFIAQEVESALTENGLTSQDFAGFTKCAGENDVHSEYVDQYYLRYTEFVALNTYMIQKLRAQVSELESEIAVLKEGQE